MKTMKKTNNQRRQAMKKVLLVGLVAVFALFMAGPAFAQSPGECTGGLCGTPDESGGGCVVAAVPF
jgi:hypothetical protein